MAMCGYTLNKSFAEDFGGSYITIQYNDVINPKPPKPEEKLTAEEIKEYVCGVIENLGRNDFE